jgi:flagellar hook-associated protein 1 FlgK
MLRALNTSQSYDTRAGLPRSMTLPDAASQMAGLQQSTFAVWTANNTAREQQAQDAKTALSNATGVNVDDELQRLITVQATYAATTQVIQAAAKMLDALMQLR